MVKRSRLKKEMLVNLTSLRMDIPTGLKYDDMLDYAQKELQKKTVWVDSVEEV